MVTCYEKRNVVITTLLTLTLLITLGFGLSVFAETDLGDGVGTVIDEVVVVEGEDQDESETATGTPITTQELNEFGDTYIREDLPSDAVVGDFVVGPGRFEIELSPGQTLTREITVANRTGRTVEFDLVAEDTAASEGSGGVTTLGDREGPYTLRDFISVPHETFILEHGTRARVPVTVSLPPDAEPGGRYGTVLTTMTSLPTVDDSEAGARTGSAIVSRIASLIFLTTPGEVNRESELIGFDTVNSVRMISHQMIRQEDSAIPFTVSVENYGTVHTNTYGAITITNMLGEVVATHTIQPFFVMPESIRTRTLDVSVREFMIGRYTAEIELNRGYDDIIDTKSVTFYVIPWMLIIFSFLGLFVFFLLVRLFFNTFEFKRKK